MNSSNFQSHSKASAIKKLRRLLYKYYVRFSEICQNSAHKFLVLLYDCVADLKDFWNSDYVGVKIR